MRTAAELAAELDVLELLTREDSDAATARASEVLVEADELTADVVTPVERETLRMRALLVQGDVLGRGGDWIASGRILQDVLAWASEHESAHVLARSHRLLSVFFARLGEVSRSLEHAVQSLQMLDEGADPVLRADHLVALADALGASGSYEEALERYAEAEDLGNRFGDVDFRLFVLNNVAYTEFEAGRVDAALLTTGRLQALARAHDAEPDLAVLDTVASVQLAAGYLAQAEQTLAPLVSVNEDDAALDPDGVSSALVTLAHIQRRRGKLALAAETLARCRRLCDENSLTAIAVLVSQEQAELFAALGDFSKAYEQHKEFHTAAMERHSAESDARARTLQAVFEVQEARRDSRRYREMSLRDPLTGMYNRRFVNDRLPELLRDGNEHGAPVTVALVDLDHFKLVNDTFSHDTGDEVLRVIAKFLEAAAGAVPDGIAARLGGEEFLLVLPGVDEADALVRLDAFRSDVASHDWSSLTGRLPVTASVGTVTSSVGHSRHAELLSIADLRLYVAKNAGRNRVVGHAG